MRRMRYRHPHLGLAFVLVASLASISPAAAEKVRRLEIVDKAIRFHGGDYYRSTETSMTVRSRSGVFDLLSRVDGDDFDHTVSGKNAEGKIRKVRQTTTSIEEWLDGQAVALDDEGKRRAQSFIEARVYFPFLPYRLNDPSVWKEDLGIEDWGGKKLHRVKVTFDAGTSNSDNDEYVYWFEPETGQMAQYAYSFGTGRERGGLRFRKLINDQRVGSILFADVENLGIDGDGRQLKVEMLTPAYVKEKMEHVSFVNLTGVRVKILTVER